MQACHPRVWGRRLSLESATLGVSALPSHKLRRDGLPDQGRHGCLLQVIAQLGQREAPAGLGEAAGEYEAEMLATLRDAAAAVTAFDARLQGERDAGRLAAAVQARETPAG